LNRSHSTQGILFGAVALAALYICFFARLDAIGLVGPDEARYAAVARTMAQSGDWVTPRLDGEPWFEKPVLYYWAAGAAFRVFGSNEFAARLPSALAALLTTLVVAWAGRRFYGAGVAPFALWLAPTCVGMLAFARAATTDMLFAFSLTLSMTCAAVLAGFPKGRRPERYWLLVFGGALGLATLAKGPAAVLLAGGSVLLWMLATRRWREAFRLAHPLAVVAWAAVALPWYVLCALRNPEFVDVFLISHNIERYLTPVFRHEQPGWFYGPILLLGLLPWTLLLPGLVWDGARVLRERTVRDSAGVFFACWVVFPILFFSFSKSKLPGYILPTIPPLVLLMARGLARWSKSSPGLCRGLLIAVGATFLVLAASTPFWLKKLPAGASIPGDAFNWIWGIAAACALLIAWPAARRRFHAAAATAALLWTLLIWVTVAFVLPPLDAHLSPRTAAQLSVGLERPAMQLRSYRLHRAWQYGLNFYLHRPVKEWSPDSLEPSLVLASQAALPELLQSGHGVTVIHEFSRQAILVAVEPGLR